MKVNIPYFCFYDVLNVIKKIKASGNRVATINSFCDIFTDGYDERQNLIEAIYDITDADEFSTTCETYYKSSYNSTKSVFDPIDMSGYMGSSSICGSLFDIFQEVSDEKKFKLSYSISYSYLMSMFMFSNI
jgi:hypothetical protein